MRMFCFLLVGGCLSLEAATVSPTFQAQSIEGKKISLDTITKPGKLVLISFWATWCVPCIQELNTLKTKLKESPDFPLEVVTVNVDGSDTRSEVRTILKQYALPFETVLDPTNEIRFKFQKSTELPFSVLLNSKKEIVETFSGYRQDMWDTITKESKKL